jgi:Fic family protein
MARCLQTLILGREAIIEPPFCSIEEYLGRYSHEYYEVLARVGQGRFHPENDCRDWIRFNLVAHFRQAAWLLQRTHITQRVWDEVERLAVSKGVNERAIPVLVDAAFGYKIRRSHYMNSAEVSEQVASRDLRILIDHGFLIGEGETRGRIYEASDKLKEIYLRHYETRSNVDPFTQEKQPFQEPSAIST